MKTNIEYCNPFNEQYNLWMRAEHLGRYLFGKDIIIEQNANTVLDIACANGYGTKILSEYCKYIVGIDNKKEYIELAKQTNYSPNIKYSILDIDEEEIDEKFDMIICFETIEHVKYPRNLLEKLYEALNDNGLLLISVPNDRFEIIENGNNKDSYHLHTFSFNELENMFKRNNFKIIDIFGQSKINKIINEIIEEPEIVNNNIYDIAKQYAYPNKEDINNSYSYIFTLKK